MHNITKVMSCVPTVTSNSIRNNGILTTGIFYSWIQCFACEHNSSAQWYYDCLHMQKTKKVCIYGLWNDSMCFHLRKGQVLHRHHKSLAHYFPSASYYKTRLFVSTQSHEPHFLGPLPFPRCGQTCPGHEQLQENSFSHTSVPFVHAIFKIKIKDLYNFGISYKHLELV